jgi:hypothetical protein
MPRVALFVMAGLVLATHVFDATGRKAWTRQPGTGENRAVKLGTPLRNRALGPVGNDHQVALKMRDGSQEPYGELDMPLTRLLAINLGIGVVLAVLLVGGLLVLNPGGLRDLILADRSPLVPIGLLLGGFIITLGSTAMGTAIMAMGVGERDNKPRGGLRVAAQQLARKRS